MSNSSALSSSCCALILAAGKGTRMHSKKPKVLHTILGEPLLGHVAGALRPLFGEAVWAVIGHEADMVRGRLRAAICVSWSRRNSSVPGTP